jgi:glycosyltransferase involved in cell wall biosynthesis
MPAVSVLMPCFNAADTLRDALESICNQSMADFEAIVVNDGSSDDSRLILQEWASRDERFRIVHQPHQGIVFALNAGLEMCSAPCIARMDADDLCHPERFAQQVEFLEHHPDTWVVGCKVRGYPPERLNQGYSIYIEWQNSLLRNEDIRREIFIESPLAHPSVMMRREHLAEVGGYQEHGWAEDYDLWLRFYLAGAEFAKIDEVLLDWREHDERLTRQDSRYSLENFLRAKAHYLVGGPLQTRASILIWGAGMMGRRLSKHLQRQGAPLDAFVDVDPDKIGRTRRGLPILPPEAISTWWRDAQNPVILSAVGSRGARSLIREELLRIGLQEGIDWWCVA